MRKTPVSDLRPPQAGPYIHAPEHTHMAGGRGSWGGREVGRERRGGQRGRWSVKFGTWLFSLSRLRFFLFF